MSVNSERKHLVYKLLEEGVPVEEIAQQVGLAIRTVKTYASEKKRIDKRMRDKAIENSIRVRADLELPFKEIICHYDGIAIPQISISSRSKAKLRGIEEKTFTKADLIELAKEIMLLASMLEDEE